MENNCICNHPRPETDCFPVIRCACKVHGRSQNLTDSRIKAIKAKFRESHAKLFREETRMIRSTRSWGQSAGMPASQEDTQTDDEFLQDFINGTEYWIEQMEHMAELADKNPSMCTYCGIDVENMRRLAEILKSGIIKP